MLSISKKPNKVRIEQQAAVGAVDKTEQLRQILSKQASRAIEYEIAQEIGSSLLEYYEVLSEEVDDEFID